MQFIDLKKQYSRIKPSIQNRINRILDDATFIMGREITELEQNLADYTGTGHCLCCASGTDALLLPLLAKGIGPGDAVFTSTFTFIATAEVISLLGATPVFVDIDDKTYNIDAKKLRQTILSIRNGKQIAAGVSQSLNPKAVIPVDLFGLCADYTEITAIAREFDLFVLEDAAQSFGAMTGSRKACSFGNAAATSFFPAKPLGCYGDGGAVFCNDDELIEHLRSLRIHGQGNDKYENVRIGLNARMDTLQAAVVLAKMEIFEEEIVLRQAKAAYYSDALTKNVTIPNLPAGMRSAWAQYSIQDDTRQATMAALAAKAVPTAIYYPKPLHLQKAFASLRYESGQFPISERVAARIFSLPMHPYLEKKDQDLIIETINTLHS